jgi:hypothetical protein
VLWKGALAIGGGTVGAAMAIVTSALMSDYQNYVPFIAIGWEKKGCCLKVASGQFSHGQVLILLYKIKHY